VIRVILADDHAVVREGLRRVLSESPDVQVVAEAEDGHAVLEAARQYSADVLLLDLRMPGPTFSELLRGVQQLKPDLPVLVLSGYPEERFALRVLRAGAAGYVPKELSSQQLLEAIRRVALGKRYVSSALGERLVESLRGDGKVPHERLSQREFEVLRLLGSGLNVKQIAASLTINPKTVTTYRARLLAKLNVRTTADLIRYAVENELT